MAATPTERVLYASKSRKWNSTQCQKFLTEFPTEHAANLDWIRETETAAAQRRVEQETRGRDDARRIAAEGEAAAAAGMGKTGEKNRGRGKWIALGIVGIVLAMRAWQ